jgi:hypothetical protein
MRKPLNSTKSVLQSPTTKYREYLTQAEYGSAPRRERSTGTPIHHFQELRSFDIALHEHFVVSNQLGNFNREHEAIGRSSIPVFNRAYSRTCVESRVNLDGVKSFGIEPEVVGGLHASRIEGAIPAGCCERRGPKKDRRRGGLGCSGNSRGGVNFRRQAFVRKS